MTGQSPPDLWLLRGLAVCGNCAAPLTPHLAGRARRFYACCCPVLHDAEPLEQIVLYAAAAQDWRQKRSLRPYIVLHRWRQADPAERRRRLALFLARVVVDADGGPPTCFWTVPDVDAHRPALPRRSDSATNRPTENW